MFSKENVNRFADLKLANEALIKSLKSTTKPLLLLDIDGALSPYVNPGDTPGLNFISVEYDVYVHAELSSWLSLLEESFTLIWTTFWEDLANEIFVPAIGFHAIPVLFFTTGVMEDTPKLANVKQLVADHAFAWIDDDLKDDAWYFASKHSHPALLVRPTASVGITQDHVTELLAFASILS